MGLRQARRFQAYFSHLEDRQVLKMSRREWDELNLAIRPGELVSIEVPPPIEAVLHGSRVEAVVAERLTASEVVIEVFRNDPKDAPNPINRDRYRVWERLPLHVDFPAMVISASTEDNANMRGFLEDHVFLVKDKVSEGHWLPELPERVRKVLRSQ